jgi:hypothetical protein
MKKVDEKAQKKSSEKLILDSESIPEHGQKELGVYTRHRCISASLILFRLLIEFVSRSLLLLSVYIVHTHPYPLPSSQSQSNERRTLERERGRDEIPVISNYSLRIDGLLLLLGLLQLIGSIHPLASYMI